MAHLISNQTTQSYNQAFIIIVSFWEHSIKSFMKHMTISSYHTLNNELSRTPHIVQPSPHPGIIWMDSWRSCPSCLRRGITTRAHLMGRWGSSHDVCHHFAVACLEDKQLNTYFTKPVFCNNSLLYKTPFFFDFFYQNWGKILTCNCNL